MPLLSRIEDKHGVDEPGYQYAEPDAPELDRKPIDHTLSFGEALVAFVIPIAGLGLAVWRFGRGDIGPGFANLQLGGLGFLAGVALLASHVI